jgi:hypothetical protein
VDIQFGDEIENPAAFPDGLEGKAGIAFAFGDPGKLTGFLQEFVILQKTILALKVLELFPGAGQFKLQVFFMAAERGDAEAVLLADRLIGLVPVQQGEVNGLALGMGAGLALHGFLRNQGSVFSKR